ncbi:MAG: PotD/PotF family extracellular solute-binding protein [Kiritimatiellae bacterium]|nr:PotD/PotF family extracellular solute-binding protein [Kiritimatiellia bacterium]MDW8458743.1 PotD/PotF family extracellular solute-binding protein [Verrucomicrobiota bacterium]
MNSKNGLSRRSFLKTAAVATAAVAAGPFSTLRSFAASREDELNILCWEGYNTENVLGPFRKAFKGVTVKAESGTDDPSMINKLRAGETKIWDLINVNQCWARDMLWPEKLIKPLNRARFEPYIEKMMKWFYSPETGINPFALSPDGKELLGMMQRFGPFSFVINTNKISATTAEDQGFPMFLDPALKGRYGILAYDNWNVMHLCITAGLNPFTQLNADQLAKFEETAEKVFEGAKMISSDLVQLNQALINGEIDLYFTGGTYTSSPARHEGRLEVLGISPKSGPIDGKGALQWFEITSLVNNPNLSPRAEDFLEFVQRPEICKAVAFAEGTYNPVSQMSNPEVFKLFSKEDLVAIQWDTLEEEMARSADYQICPNNDELTDIYNKVKRKRV